MFGFRTATFLLYIFASVFFTALPCAASDKLVHVVTFKDYSVGPVENWLAAKGFQLEQDAKYRDRIDLDVSPEGLVVEAKRHAFGFMPNESVNVPDFSFIEIDWGISKQAVGAAYAQGRRSEAIMIVIFMGDERQPSGSMFIPDSPFFIGLFLCSGEDKINHPYVGKYYRKSGRFVCLDSPDAGRLITSRFNLLEAYRAYFDKENDDDPGISGIAISLDTKKTSDAGTSSAFVREIRFYK